MSRRPLRPTALSGAIAVLLTLPFVPAAQAATGFADPAVYHMILPSEVTIHDMNEDENPDLVSVGGRFASVRLGNGDGTFGGRTDFEHEGGDSASMDIGDVDGDGHADVAVADRWDRKIFLLTGDGKGKLAPAATIGTLDTPEDVAIGDFGGDAGADVAVTERYEGEIRTFIQQSDGKFAAAEPLAVKGVYPGELRVADLDENGKDDLITLDGVSDDLEVFLQSATGFDPPAIYDVGYGSSGFAIADIDAAPGLDVAVAETGTDTVSTFSGSASGALSQRVAHPTYSGPVSVAVADLDADGDQDLITPVNAQEGIGVLLAKDGGGYASAFASSTGVVSYGYGIGTAELDGDGELDLIVRQNGHTGVAVLLGDVLRLEPDWLDFGEVTAGDFATDAITVRNTGSGPLEPGGVTLLEGADRFAVDQGDCVGRTLQPRESCSFLVAFGAPAGVTASFEGVVQVAGDSASGPRFATVFGSSFNEGHVAVDPSAVGFGSVHYGTSATRTVTVRNGGESAITMRAATLAVSRPRPSSTFAITSDGCANRVLGPGATCAIEVTFQPNSPIRRLAYSFSSTLHVTSMNPSSYASVALTGVATTPPAPPVKPMIGQALSRLTLELPALLRGGSRRLLRLPAFTAPTDGTLSLQLRARRTLLTRTSRFVGWNDPRRLAFRLTKKGRKVLRRPYATRVKVTVAFRTAAGEMTVRRSTVTVKRPRR